jgi:hypothetical protein
VTCRSIDRSIDDDDPLVRITGARSTRRWSWCDADLRRVPKRSQDVLGSNPAYDLINEWMSERTNEQGCLLRHVYTVSNLSIRMYLICIRMYVDRPTGTRSIGFLSFFSLRLWSLLWPTNMHTYMHTYTHT